MHQNIWLVVLAQWVNVATSKQDTWTSVLSSIKLKHFIPHMNLRQRKQVIGSKVLGIASYGLATYIGQTELVKDRLHAIYMRAYRVVYGQPLPLNTESSWICRKIGVKSPRQQILEASMKLVHKIINTQLPAQIFNMLSFSTHFRISAPVRVKNCPRTIKCRRSTIYKAIRTFNGLENNIKYIHPKTFKAVIAKKTIREIPYD